MSNKAQAGYTFISLLISLSISLIMFGCILHYIFVIIKVYNRSHQQFEQQNSQLIARHYLATDIHNANHIKAGSNLLLLNNSEKISYYLSNSVVPNAKNRQIYALYRDDSQHNAVAIIEDLTDFKVTIKNMANDKAAVRISLVFKNFKKTDMTFVIKSTKIAG